MNKLEVIILPSESQECKMKSVRCMMSFGAITFSQLLNQQLEEEKRVHMESEKFLQKKFEVGETLRV